MLSTYPIWAQLSNHFQRIQHTTLRDWFAQSPDRVQDLTFEAAHLFVDFSKNRLEKQTIDLLVELAQQAQLATWRDKMFAGEIINHTEQRAALHTALRSSKKNTPHFDAIQTQLTKMQTLAEQIRAGQFKGFSGKSIKHIINIGIGGSDLGPKMVCHALAYLQHPELRFDFISNIDGSQLSRLLKSANPEETLFIIVSKTFTTRETMTNADSARQWLLAKGCAESLLKHHFIGVSAHPEKMHAFGIAPECALSMWDWVGGRFSLWSAAGLSIMISIGNQRFQALLSGAHDMDQHFAQAPFAENIPVLMALIGIWYRNFFNAQSYLTAPYSDELRDLPAYLQQLEMESNGKSINIFQQTIDYDTAPITWGQPGTNSQHAFFQMLHQGTTLIPVDFIGILNPSHALSNHHTILLANCIAQSEALMLGRTLEEAQTWLNNAPLAAHASFSGNRPSTTILLEQLDAQSLGALIALYEHKTFVQGVIWRINSFDQWGVELGKTLSQQIEIDLAQPHSAQHDASTQQLIEKARHALKKAL